MTKMGYITHNVNRFLVLLIVFISVALVTATAFFASEFQGMSDVQNGNLAELQELETELRIQRALNVEYEKNLALKEKREDILKKVLEQERAKQEVEQETRFVSKRFVSKSTSSKIKPENVYDGPSLSYFGVY